MKRFTMTVLLLLNLLDQNTYAAKICHFDSLTTGATPEAPLYKTYSGDEIGLIKAIQANEDRTPALAYADFLDEQSNPVGHQQAAAIRLAIDLDLNPPKRRLLGFRPDPRVAKLSALRQALEWEQPLRKGEKEADVTVQFQNGVPIGVTLKGKFQYDNNKLVSRLVDNNPAISAVSLNTDRVQGLPRAKDVLVRAAAKGHPGAIARLEAELTKWEDALSSRRANDEEPYFPFERALLEDLQDRTGNFGFARRLNSLKGLSAEDLYRQYSPEMLSLFRRYQDAIERGHRPAQFGLHGASELKATLKQLTGRTDWEDLLVLANGAFDLKKEKIGPEIVARMDTLHANNKLPLATSGKIFPIQLKGKTFNREQDLLQLIVKNSRVSTLVLQARVRLEAIEEETRQRNEPPAYDYDAEPDYFW